MRALMPATPARAAASPIRCTTRRDDSTRHRPAVTFGGALYPPENQYDVTDRAVVARLARLARDAGGHDEDVGAFEVQPVQIEPNFTG